MENRGEFRIKKKEKLDISYTFCRENLDYFFFQNGINPVLHTHVKLCLHVTGM